MKRAAARSKARPHCTGTLGQWARASIWRIPRRSGQPSAPREHGGRANLLLYASDGGSPLHAACVQVLADLADGPELVYLFWPIAMAYLRIATHPSVFRQPLSRAQAEGNLEQLLGRPHVRSPGEKDGFWTAYQAAAQPAGARGKLVADAHLVALMHQHGLTTILTRDRDFRRFDGIRVIDPLAS